MSHYSSKSMTRSPTRTLLAMLTVAAAVGSTIVVMRYAAAVMIVLKQGAWDTGLAHMQVHADGYDLKAEGLAEEYLIDRNHKLEEIVDKDPRVEGWSRRINFEGLASSRAKSIYFVGIAIEAEKENTVSPHIFTSKDEGEWVNNDDILGVVVGRGLARTLDIGIGDTFVLISQTLDGSQNGMDVRVRGIVDIPLPSFSKRTVYVPINLAQELLRTGTKYSEMAIRLKAHENIDPFYAQFKPIDKGHGLLLRWWGDIQPMIINIEKIWNGIVGFITTALFGLAGISVANMILMVVNERTIEIGTLMAIGARKSVIYRLFAWESMMVGMLGGGAGLIVGLIIVAIMGAFGVPFDNPFGADQVIVYPKVSFSQASLIWLGGVAICFVGSLYPSRKAAGVEPVKAFRGQIG